MIDFHHIDYKLRFEPAFDMKKIIINFFVLMICIYGLWYCHDYYFFGKKNPLKTHFLGNGIYEERFKSFEGGVLMGNIITYYITDSTTFRRYIGNCDEDEMFKCKVENEYIKVVKWSWKNWYKTEKETPADSAIYSIKELKLEGKFE